MSLFPKILTTILIMLSSLPAPVCNSIQKVQLSVVKNTKQQISISNNHDDKNDNNDNINENTDENMQQKLVIGSKNSIINKYGDQDINRNNDNNQNNDKIGKTDVQHGLNYNQKGEITSMNISIGVPEQYFQILLDTGSNQFWIASDNSIGCEKPNTDTNDTDDNRTYKLTKFNPNISTTLMPLYYPAQLHYVCCSVYGKLFQQIIKMDKIQIFSYMMITQLCTKENIGYDGVMGLGANKNMDNIIDSAYKRKQIVSDIFVFQMGRREFKEKSYFYYNFSQSQIKEYFGNVMYQSVALGDWGFWIKQAKINNQLMKIDRVSIDTGSAHTFMHMNNFNKIFTKYFQKHCKILKLGLIFRIIRCNCTNFHQFPNLTFTANNIKITLTPLSYLQQTDIQNQCQLSLDGFDIKYFQKRIVIGGRFYQIFTVVHQKERQRIGFVKTKRYQQQKQNNNNNNNNNNRNKNKDKRDKADSVMVQYADQQIFGIFQIVTVILVGVVVCVFYRTCKAKENGNMREMSELRNDLNNQNNENQIYGGNNYVNQELKNSEFKQMTEINHKQNNIDEINV